MLLPKPDAKAQRGTATCLGEPSREALGGGGPSLPPLPPRAHAHRSEGLLVAWGVLLWADIASLPHRCSPQASRPASEPCSSSTRATSSSTSASTRIARARSCRRPGSACPACMCVPWRRRPEPSHPLRAPAPVGAAGPPGARLPSTSPPCPHPSSFLLCPRHGSLTPSRTGRPSAGAWH